MKKGIFFFLTKLILFIFQQLFKKLLILGSRKNILNEKVSIKLKSDQNKMNEIDCKMEEEFDGSELSVEG